MRYTVKRCFYPYGKNATNRKEMKIILDGKFPAIEVNRHLVLAQIDKEKPLGTPIYYLCIYLNYLDENDIDMLEAKMSDIQDFLQELYIDGLPYAGNGEPKSYTAILDYIEVLSKLYDNLTLRGYKLDESLYTRSQLMMLAPAPRKSVKTGHVISSLTVD